MIELHGWVTIRETYKVTVQEDNEDIIIDNIKREIDLRESVYTYIHTHVHIYSKSTLHIW